MNRIARLIHDLLPAVGAAGCTLPKIKPGPDPNVTWSEGNQYYYYVPGCHLDPKPFIAWGKRRAIVPAFEQWLEKMEEGKKCAARNPDYWEKLDVKTVSEDENSYRAYWGWARMEAPFFPGVADIFPRAEDVVVDDEEPECFKVSFFMAAYRMQFFCED